MGFLSEIKKLLFVKKSVAKSAANKTGDFIKDKAEDLAESSKEFIMDSGDVVSSKSSGLRDAVLEKSKSFIGRGKDLAEDIVEKGKDIYDDVSESETAKKMADFTEDIGEKVLDTSGKLVDKAKTVSETVGGKILHTGGDLSEKIGRKVFEIKEDIVDKAKDLSDDFSDSLDETIEKAQKFEAEERAKPKKEFSDETLDASGSLLDGTDDFFEKAAKYADGDYEAIREGTTTILDEKTEDLPKREIAKAAGFEDLDGDGNEIIDDALIIYSDEEE